MSLVCFPLIALRMVTSNISKMLVAVQLAQTYMERGYITPSIAFDRVNIKIGSASTLKRATPPLNLSESVKV